ncbi:transcriptional regulator, TetR family [Actinokineospora diospyrosa]|uniref:Transcriptional regulator, TetR family n=1 Tax=Actinokineospora diospyrosa TaxID=103728 RepID=A0ABT1IJT5_9PSEU|nr:TetR/AcrR family transcriptional regulator [Actinokineospora diospyrosa]MCP2272917.1 transcriptional regulator, TetR family [Actinokineospora diospyrosa]
MVVPRRTRDDWTAVALAALAEGGLAAVAVEPLAARAGATKGSVYWHFPTRDALVEATLARWELEHTEAVIAHAEQGATPPERLRRLIGAVLHPERGIDIEMALHASLGDPLVAAAVARVGQRRMDYVVTLFTELGFTKTQARRRAVTAYAVYLGQAQLHRTNPDVAPSTPAAKRAYMADVMGVLLADPGPPRPAEADG